MTKVAVVILNYNGKSLLAKFLPGVIGHSKAFAEVIVADNASTDGSVEMLKERFPTVRVIVHPSNGGFTSGYNLALKQIDADFFILLNSDIEVTQGWISPIIRLMESDKRIAACQPKILSVVMPSHFEYAGAGGGLIDQYGYPFCRGRLFNHLEEDKGQYNDTSEVFWASGACMFVRAEAYHRIGGFDDSFFAHMEEIDLCWRLKNEGYKIMYCGESTVYHIGGGTLPKISARKTYFNFRNNLSLLVKNLPRKVMVHTIILRLFLDGAASVKFLLEGNISHFFAVLRAHLHFYRKMPQLLYKRTKLKQTKVTCIYRKNVAIDYFLLGKREFGELNRDLFSN
jgi:GT2 family glycosyltransferase